MRRSPVFYMKRNLHRAKKEGTWNGTMYGFPSGPSPLKRAHRIGYSLYEFDSDTGVWKRRFFPLQKV